MQDINSFTSLIKYFDENENGNPAFKCTKFQLVGKEEHTAWIGSLEIPKMQVTINQAIGCLRHVPENGHQ